MNALTGKKLRGERYVVLRHLKICLLSGLLFTLITGVQAQRLIPVLDGRTSLYYYSDSSLTMPADARMFDFAELYSEGVASVMLGDNWGFINTAHEFVIQPVFMEALPFRNGFAAVIDRQGRSNFCRHDGSLLCLAGFDITRSFSGDLALVALNNKWGFVDTTGNIAIPLVFDRASDFSEGLAAVKKNGKWGFIDTKGTFVIPAIFDRVSKFSQNLAGTELNGQLSYIDRKGTAVIQLPATKEIAGLNPFYQNRSWVKAGTEWQMLDSQGNIIQKMNCENILPCSEGYSLFKANGVWGYMDAYGKVVITAQFQEALPFENGFAKIFADGKYYLVDKKGKIYIKHLE